MGSRRARTPHYPQQRLSLQVSPAKTTVISSLPAVTGPADEWRWLTEGVAGTLAYAFSADLQTDHRRSAG